LAQAMEEVQEAVVSAAQALKSARTVEAEAERAFHAGILGAKAEVLTQYGADSSAVQLVGLTRKSERRRPVRRDNGTS
jgi:hypothetical protein